MGGAETSLLELLKSLRSAQPDWELSLVLGAAGPLVGKVKPLGVLTKVIPFPRQLASFGDSDSAVGGARLYKAVGAFYNSLRYLSQLTAFLRELNPELIHSNGFKMHLLGAWARPSKIPVIWHIHDYVSSRPLMKTLLRWHRGKCDVIIANSNSVRDDVESVCAPPPEVTTIYNSVDLKRFSPIGPTIDLDAAAGLQSAPAGTLRIGLVATFARWKGHMLFLESLSRLPSDIALRAYIIGGPIYQTNGSQHTLAELRAEVERLGLGGRVGFTNFIHPVDAALRSLDVVVHASTQPEPFGMVIVEAMACGKAVVASKQSGACELFSHGRDMLSYQCGDVGEMAEQILFLLRDTSMRCQLGVNARRSVQQAFDDSRIASELNHLYKRVKFHGQVQEFANS
jgi:glycosyltransferase involved in cell wall biosynthesis